MPRNPRFINSVNEYHDVWVPELNVLTQLPVSTETRLRTVYFVRAEETCKRDDPPPQVPPSVSSVAPLPQNTLDNDLSRWLNVYRFERSTNDLLGILGGKPHRVILVLKEAVGFLFLVLQKNGLTTPLHNNLNILRIINWQHQSALGIWEIGNSVALAVAAGIDMTGQVPYDLVGLQRIGIMPTVYYGH